MDQVISLLQKISNQIEQGNVDWIKTLISTLAGLIVGTLMNEVFQRIGKIKIECNRAEQIFYKKEKGPRGSEIKVNINENPEYAKCYVDVTMYNTSKNRKILKNIKITVYKKWKIIDHYFVFNKAIGIEKINIINIDDKSIKEFKLEFKLDKRVMTNITDLKNSIKIYLCYNTEAIIFKSKKFKLFKLWM